MIMSIISWDEFRKQQKGEYLLTIDSADLRLGDFVISVDAGRADFNFPDAGQQVETFEQKKRLQIHCRRVVIDLQRCLNRRPSGADAALSKAAALPRISGSMNVLRERQMSARGLMDVWPVYRHLSLAAQSLILSFHRHGQIDLEGTLEAITDLLEVMDEHMANLLWLARIKEKSRYSFQHGLNVAILGAAFAQAAGWEARIQKAVALSGLLHDLGKMRINLKVLHKTGRLTPAELDHVRLHTTLGYELLSQNDSVPTAVAQAVLCHHERPDGQGYPEGLTREGIPGLARLIGLLDAYDAMTSHRFHAEAISHQKALGEIWKLRGEQFDSELAEPFCQFLGWAPPGTLLRLPDQRLAVALHTPGSQARPIVRQLDHRGEGFEFGVEVDLNTFSFGAEHEGKYGTPLPDAFSGINLRDLTRKLPKTLRKSAGEDTDLDQVVQRERRSRPRVDAPRGTHILVVDDSLTMRKTLENMLSQSGYRVSLAEDGVGGVERATEEIPDLVLLDIVLPDISGFRALRKLRKDKRTANVPVIMISGNAGAIEKFFLQRVGVDDFIHKPFGRFEVFGAIERLVRAGTLPQRKVS
jgi:response regulator RpfG family c-di-GMP phosphodiesterase